MFENIKTIFHFKNRRKKKKQRKKKQEEGNNIRTK